MKNLSEESSKKMKNLGAVLVIGAFIFALLFLCSDALGQDGVLPDTVRVNFSYKHPSKVEECYLAELNSLGDLLKFYPDLDYQVFVSVDSVQWVNYEQNFIEVVDSTKFIDVYFHPGLDEVGVDSLGRIYDLSLDTKADISWLKYNQYIPKGKRKIYRKKEESDIFNAALLLSRPYAVFQVMDIPLELSKVVFVPERKERYVEVLVVRKPPGLLDLENSISILNKGAFGQESHLADLDSTVSGLDNRVKNLEKQESLYNWSLVAGWHKVSFGTEDFVERDLSALMAGIRFSYKSYFLQVQGGLNPWSFQGYQGYWYRDVLGSAEFGYDFYKKNKWVINLQAGGLIGWKYTSDTNEFDLQILGILAGLGIERELKKDVSVGFSLSLTHAETSDVTAETGKMRNGVYFSAFLKIF